MKTAKGLNGYDLMACFGSLTSREFYKFNQDTSYQNDPNWISLYESDLLLDERDQQVAFYRQMRQFNVQKGIGNQTIWGYEGTSLYPITPVSDANFDLY